MSIDKTLEERGARYGKFSDHAAIAQALQDVLRAAPGWARLTAVQKQALTVICDKQARILSGDPNYADNWHDIQGYAKLAEDDLFTAGGLPPEVVRELKEGTPEVGAKPLEAAKRAFEEHLWAGSSRCFVCGKDHGNTGLPCPNATPTAGRSIPSEPEWIKWDGGLCPVPFETIVEVKLYQGGLSRGQAGNYQWMHHGVAPSAQIVKYRVVSSGEGALKSR